MLKRTVLALGFAALAAPWCSTPGEAALAANALAANALAANAVAANGPVANFVTLQAVRLALPDGSEVTFR